jgi:ATP-dependent DNA helicase DinG
VTSRPESFVADLLAAAVAAVGGAHRPGQLQMAEAVAEAIGKREHLLVQAGTGTGKSLAYLVPGVVHALEQDEPVIVATATLALQAQLVDRDLPALVEAVEPLVERRPTFAILKGRHHYLCRYRLDHGAADEAEGLFATGSMSPATDLERQTVRVREWAEKTSTGDRDELDPGVDNRVWTAVSVTSRECLGASKCPLAADCFAEQARERAMQADIVVTNHAMLAIDALENVQVLPEHDVVIVDEGHELADRVTGAATGELSPSAVDRAARRAMRHATVEVAESFQQAGFDLAAVLAAMDDGRLDVLPDDLALALAVLRDSARSLVADLGEDGGGAGAGGADPDADAGRRQARASVEELLEVADRLIAHVEADVAWLEVTDRRGPVLHIAPLDVAPLLRTGLFGGRTVVLTSATLQLGGSFDAAARSVGLFVGGEDGAPAWRGIDVGSPFDYPRQGILYVARHLPAPGPSGPSEAALDELAELVTAAGGRTLGLFSSRRAAETAAAALRGRVDFPVLCQGDDTMALLVRRFRAEDRTCLFGTLSLWQGVDVPGPACQLVVIDRIPFPRPDDPLASARQRAVNRAGGNGFMSVAATQAALKLAQGAGRLIRSQGDRGVVAVLDSRLATARYASFLRTSMPPLWWTTDREVVRRSLAAIDRAAVEAALGEPVPL